jgi:hypothetical protein
MTQYPSHTDQTVSYLQQYLREFHENKAVFLRFRADKKTKKAAAEAHKTLLKQQGRVSVQDLTTSEKIKLQKENTMERQGLVEEILTEGAHYNFPKIHLISHYAEQIPKFGALGQYSTDISEAMHKGFKDAYRRSNKVDSTSQIVTTYTRDHTFAMKDLTIKAWSRDNQERSPTTGVRKGTEGGKVYLKLAGKFDFGTVSTIADLENVTGLCDLRLATKVFLTRAHRGTNSDIVRLLDWDIRGYRSLQIPVPRFSGLGFLVHHARCTGVGEFRGGKRNDWIWVRRHEESDRMQQGTLNGRRPAKLNALFKLKSEDGTIYRLAHVTMLRCIGGTALQGVEGMLRVGFPPMAEGMVVPIAKIEGMAHLIPLEPGESWLVNNRVDLETWNTIYD